MLMKNLYRQFFNITLMTRRKLAWAKNFIKEGMEPINNTIPLALTLCGLSSLALASFFELPFPYNLIALITILGPTTITVYGLKKQLNIRKTSKKFSKEIS